MCVSIRQISFSPHREAEVLLGSPEDLIYKRSQVRYIALFRVLLNRELMHLTG